MAKSSNLKPTTQKGQSQANMVAQSSHSLIYSGPLPPAGEMEKYEKICTGAADRILRMAEQQAEHRQHIEKIAVRASSIRSVLGVIFAFCIALMAFILSGICFYLGNLKTGVAIFGTTLASVVGIFIYGTNSNRQEREEKWDKAHSVSE